MTHTLYKAEDVFVITRTCTHPSYLPLEVNRELLATHVHQATFTKSILTLLASPSVSAQLDSPTTDPMTVAARRSAATTNLLTVYPALLVTHAVIPALLVVDTVVLHVQRMLIWYMMIMDLIACVIIQLFI